MASDREKSSPRILPPIMTNPHPLIDFPEAPTSADRLLIWRMCAQSTDKPKPAYFGVAAVLERDGARMSAYIDNSLEGLSKDLDNMWNYSPLRLQTGSDEEVEAYWEQRGKYTKKIALERRRLRVMEPFLHKLADGYLHAGDMLKYALLVDETNGKPKEHPNWWEVDLGEIVDTGFGEISHAALFDIEMRNNFILQAIRQDSTGIALLRYREQEIIRMIQGSGKAPERHPLLIGFRLGIQRVEQFTDITGGDKQLAA